MPELPEAETIVKGLRSSLVRRSISSIEVLKEDLLDLPPRRFSRALRRGLVSHVSRRGKNVVLRIDSGSQDGANALLVFNLGMSGRLLHRAVGDRSQEPSHPGVRFLLDDGSRLVYHDIRRFGRLSVMSPVAFQRWSESMGPEPLSHRFTSWDMIRRLERSGSPIRSWLLDQKKIAGVGNIYANEALAVARIHPLRPARHLSLDEGRRLHRSLRSVLRAAVSAKGTTLRDYRTAQGWKGSYADRLRVYGREGKPCGRCGNSIERLAFGGRSAFFCPTCQPLNEAVS